MLKKYFVFSILLAVLLGLLFPNFFVLLKPALVWLLGLIMLIVGMNVKYEEFRDIRKFKYKILVAVLIKFIFVSLLAFMIGKLFGLSQYAFIGLVIVGCCPGGTASNLMALLSKANLSLTVLLTLLTSILAPIMMPVTLFVLLHKVVEVPVLHIITTMLMVALLPLCMGGIIHKTKILNQYFTQKLSNLAVLSILLIITIIVSLNEKLFYHIPFNLLLACLTLNILAYLIGYLTSVIMKFEYKERLSLVYEFSILDVGLGIIIALTFFSPETALAGTIYAILQNITGPIIVYMANRMHKKAIIPGVIN
ncbi:bile acid:sodium symporter [Paraphotobacterium marinum]|uniref:Bile acid:sodium symporter n=1 Tax=Paraphotobacterium marinum TaxID=1755811 RepID=A0A220VG48_9GAMM|nr:bile acid:sodium symporter family protein [Paraphotobacterium marinum]ASK79206.1 bile acid:sodium symporter [Paraphotobacterium marinum]